MIFVLVIIKIFFYQVIWSYSLREKSLSQMYKTEKIIPLRGEIRDVDDFPLVFNITNYKIAIYKPNLKLDLISIFNQINTIKPDFIKNNQNAINLFIGNINQKWYVFPTLFTNPEIKQIDLDGVSFEKVETRYFPETDLAKIILNGLEAYYNKQLSGKTGFILSPKDAIGNTLLTQRTWNINSTNGVNLHTGIHRNIQYYVEKTLKKGLEEYQADSGSVIIMDSKIGNIIAMSSLEASPSGKNIAISDLFEPGSIFKPLVVSIALDTNSIKPDYICPRCATPFKIGEYDITNWDEKFHPNTDLKDIIKNSDNIGMVNIMENIDQAKFLEYFQKLKLTQKTGIDLQGESKSYPKTYWSHIDLATAAFGQGFAVNQLQFLQAFNVIANNGYLIQPKIVDHFDTDNGTIQLKKPAPVQIFKNETIAEIKKILKYSVETGPLNRLKPADIEVCAKSGTAQVALGGNYTDSSVIASYVGFSPCDNAKYTMIVTLNNPKTSIWGSQTAAPIWYELTAYLSNLL